MIQKNTGEKINTLQELLSVVKPDFNSYSGSRITISGEVLYNGKKVQAYRHWSHAGNIGLYEGDSNHRIAEIQNANDWFPYVVNGVEQVDELGNTISDCNIVAVPVGKRTKCYSVRLESLVSISDKAYRATAFDGSTAIIPKSQVFGDDNEVQKSEAYWIAAFILEKEGCSLQYSSKKVKWFNK